MANSPVHRSSLFPGAQALLALEKQGHGFIRASRLHLVKVGQVVLAAGAAGLHGLHILPHFLAPQHILRPFFFCRWEELVTQAMRRFRRQTVRAPAPSAPRCVGEKRWTCCGLSTQSARGRAACIETGRGRSHTPTATSNSPRAADSRTRGRT